MARYRFGEFELDVTAGELRRDGEPVKLQPQPFKVLVLLLDRAGDLVTREELKKALWGEETYVDFERGLNFCINQVRAALGDSAEAPRFVQTLPRRGYRLIVPVQSGFRVSSEATLNLSTERLRVDWHVVAIGIAILAILVAGATFLVRRTSNATPAGTMTRTMVAVLPFEDLTGDPPPPWFADGLTEELIAQLGRVSPQRLGVIARTSAMAYRGSNKTIAEIGRELRVSHVLEGSVRRDGNRLRISVQLVNSADQAPVWSETYDRTVHGALTIQSEVAAQVTRALAVELQAAPWTQATWTGTHNPDARDAYLRGRYFEGRGQVGDFRAALQQFEEAARLDPKFAAARAAQATAYHLLAMSGQTAAAQAYAAADAAARDALRLDSDLAAAHVARGLAQLWGQWNPAAAAASFQRALALNPSDASAHHDLAWSLVALERFDEAVSHITRARDLDPLSPRASNDIGWMYLHIRQPSEAARACRQTLTIDADSVEAQQCLERAYLQRGELTEALAAARTAAERSQGPVAAALTDNGPAQARIAALWRWRLARLQSLAAQRYVSPYTLAMHHMVLGENDDALAQLERAFAERNPMMVMVRTDPLFDRLRANPRFERLLTRIREHPQP